MKHPKANRLSSYRAAVVEDGFRVELQKHIWQTDLEHVEVLSPRVDDSGYDLVLEAGGIMRHVQIKTMGNQSSTSVFKVHTELERKPAGCVIVIMCDDDTLAITKYLFFGSGPREALPSIQDFKIAKHTKRDGNRVRAERPAIRDVRIAKFKIFATISELAVQLFGEQAA